MALDTIEAKLQDPFEPNDIKWRVQQSGIGGKGKPWMIVLPYITGRAIQKRLDDVFGVFGWEVEQKETLTGDGFLTTLRVWHEGRWISKTDVAPKTGVEPLKGGASGGLKRAGALFGIGRYLYQLESGFANCVPCDNRYQAMYNYAEIKNNGTKFGVDWQPPELPDWALPGLDAEKFKEAISSATCLLDVKAAYDDAYRWAASFSRTDLIKQFKDIREATIENLQSEAMKDVSAKEQEVSAWLDNKIKDINSIVYAGTVQNLGNNAAIELMKKCEGQHFDKQALEKKLKQAVKDRVKTLEGK